MGAVAQGITSRNNDGRFCLNLKFYVEHTNKKGNGVGYKVFYIPYLL